MVKPHLATLDNSQNIVMMLSQYMTTYTIEVTKTNKPKSGYKIRWANLPLHQAAFYWRGLNIGNGYKARVRDDETKKITNRKA